MNRQSLLLSLCALAVVGASGVAQGVLPPTRTGLLYISGYGSGSVGEYLPDGTLLRTLSVAGMVQPRGIALDDEGRLVVVCEGSQRILRLDLDGSVLQTITHADLTSGTGISRSATGAWYVGNFNPGRVLVFDGSWNYQRTITATGMNGVNCVSFDSNGSGGFAVTAALVNLVYRFDASGSVLGTVSHPNLLSPMSISDDSSGNHYVSGGSSGVVVKFDAAWSPVGIIGQGVLSGPQGIAVDERDQLTISNFFANVVHRYDTSGGLLGGFPLTGITTGRNLAWQTSPRVLARRGTVNGAHGYPVATLTVNGSTGDVMGRVSVGQTQSAQIDLAAPPQGPASAPFILYGALGEPDLQDVEILPFGIGLFSFKTPLGGGAPFVFVNGLGAEPLLGFGLLAPDPAPATVLSLPGGVGVPLTITLQGVILDAGSPGAPAVPLSVTNALVVEIN